MSGPKVDVLARMAEMISFMEASYPHYDCAKKLRAARAAVAELIEAAKPVCAALHATRMIMQDKETRDYAGGDR